jgi:hypothetical protein
MYRQTPSGFAGHMPYGQVTPGHGDGLDEYYEALHPQWSGVETVGQSFRVPVLRFSWLTNRYAA